MAAFVVTELVDNFRGISRGSRRHLRDAFDGGSAVADKSLALVMGEPQFLIRGTTDSNTAAASSPVISLSDYGVDFPADHVRRITVDTIAWNGANRYHFRTRQSVLGGTNPTLKGTETFLTNCTATYVGTLSSGTPTAVAAECVSPEWWDGAAPTAAAFSSGDGVITWLGTNSPVRALTPLAGIVAPTSADVTDAIVTLHAVTSLTNGTTTLTTGTYEGTEAEENAADGRIVAQAILYPPVHTPILIDTTSTPDEVWIGALGISSDVVEYYIRVYLEDPVRALLA